MDREEIIEMLKQVTNNYNCLSFLKNTFCRAGLHSSAESALYDYHADLLEAELKKARREVAKEIRADIWRENRNVHNRSADIVKAVFVKLEEIIDQNKVDEA